MKERRISSLPDLAQLARDLHAAYPHVHVYLLEGELGSGKTAFVQQFCRNMGVGGEVSSPTFGIVNEYRAEGKKIYHFDLYRIRHEEELYEFGFEDYLDEDALVFIEWPELARPFLDGPVLEVKFEVMEGGQRKVMWEEIKN